MRSKTLVPIGQGCRIAKRPRFADLQPKHSRCEAHPHLYLNICMGCGDKFHSEMPHTKTCSGRCRTALWRMRRFDKVFQMVMVFAEGAA